MDITELAYLEKFETSLARILLDGFTAWRRAVAGALLASGVILRTSPRNVIPLNLLRNPLIRESNNR
jgi:hypothetical protein